MLISPSCDSFVTLMPAVMFRINIHAAWLGTLGGGMASLGSVSPSKGGQHVTLMMDLIPLGGGHSAQKPLMVFDRMEIFERFFPN